jgi:hypothetical protein
MLDKLVKTIAIFQAEHVQHDWMINEVLANMRRNRQPFQYHAPKAHSLTDPREYGDLGTSGT